MIFPTGPPGEGIRLGKGPAAWNSDCVTGEAWGSSREFVGVGGGVGGSGARIVCQRAKSMLFFSCATKYLSEGIESLASLADEGVIR